MINFNETNSFMGKALKVSNGFIEFTVASEAGPRIIAFNKVGGANMFFQDENLEKAKDVSKVYGEGKKWNIYGGHRLWLSPEDEYTYVPDNDKVVVEKIDNGIIATAKKWDILGVRPSIKVEFEGDYSLKVTHKMINTGEEKELCLWGLTVLKPGGKMEFALEHKDTGYLPNRNLVFWPYTDIKDSRLEVFNNKVVIKSTEKISKPLKLGAYKQDFKATYTMGNNIFIKEFCGYDDETYPDFGCNFETYVSDAIHEIESLSPIKLTPKDGSIEFSERWTLE